MGIGVRSIVTPEEITDRTVEIVEHARTVFVDEQLEPYERGRAIANLLKHGTAKTERLRSGFRIIKNLMPDMVKESVLEKLKYQFDDFPIDFTEYNNARRFGYGYVNHVFCLESVDPNEPSYALKIGRRLRNQNPHWLMEYATNMRGESEYIHSLFESRPDMAPMEHYFIAPTITSSNMEACVVGIQQLLGGRIDDFFGIPPHAVRSLLLSSPKFEQDLRLLQEVLLREDSPLLNSERGIDLIGKRNLSIVNIDEDPRIVIIDPHFQTFGGTPESINPEIRRRVEYISQIE